MQLETHQLTQVGIFVVFRTETSNHGNCALPAYPGLAFENVHCCSGDFVRFTYGFTSYDKHSKKPQSFMCLDTWHSFRPEIRTQDILICGVRGSHNPHVSPSPPPYLPVLIQKRLNVFGQGSFGQTKVTSDSSVTRLGEISPFGRIFFALGEIFFRSLFTIGRFFGQNFIYFGRIFFQVYLLLGEFFQRFGRIFFKPSGHTAATRQQAVQGNAGAPFTSRTKILGTKKSSYRADAQGRAHLSESIPTRKSLGKFSKTYQP